MPIAKPENNYRGKVCAKHPALGGARLKCNGTCLQCSRDSCNARRIAKREAAGKSPRVLYTPEQAAERIRLRDLRRNAIRRKDPEYAHAQILRKRAWRARTGRN